MKRLLAIYLTIIVLATGAALSGMVAASAQESVDAELSQAITQLTADQKAALLVLVNSIVKAQQPQESPEDGAMKTVKAYVKAAEEADLVALMEQISDDFNHYEVGDKAGYQTFVQQVKDEGMLEDITGNTEEAKAAVNGEVVTVSPVELEGIFGTVTLEFELKQKDGVWKITGLDMSGV